MKRVIGLLLVFTIALSCGVSAEVVKKVTGKTVYTDIVAKINGYDIPSYNIDGYTVIVAEDLENYGFDVIWVPDARTLRIKSDKRENTVKSTYVAPEVPKEKKGKKAYDVLYTDIITFLDGEIIKSYNIGGRTAISFDALKRYDKVKYDNSKRVISVNLPWVKIAPYSAATGVPADAYAELKSFIKENGEYDSKYNRYVYTYSYLSGLLVLKMTYRSGKGDIIISEEMKVATGEAAYIETTIGKGGIPKDGMVMLAGIASAMFKYTPEGEAEIVSENYLGYRIEDDAKEILTDYSLVDAALKKLGVNVKISDFGIRYQD